MSTKPARPHNAIDQIVFVIGIDNPSDSGYLLDDEAISSGSFKLSDAKEFSVSPIHIVLFNEDVSPNVSLVKGGYEFRSEEVVFGTKKPKWAVSIDPNSIAVTCREYTRWAEVWAEVEGYFKTILQKVDTSKFKPVEIVLQCADVFISENDDYSISDVFDENSMFLSRKVKKSGSVWHINQGWFSDSCSAQFKALNNLNISVSPIESKSSVRTVIDHSVKVRGFSYKEDPSGYGSLFGDEESSLKNIFESSHKMNKDIIQNLLSSEMTAKIGMKKDE